MDEKTREEFMKDVKEHGWRAAAAISNRKEEKEEGDFPDPFPSAVRRPGPPGIKTRGEE